MEDFSDQLAWWVLASVGICGLYLVNKVPIHPAFARKNIEHSSFATSLKLRYRCETQALQIRPTCLRLYLGLRIGVSCRSISLVDTEAELPNFRRWDYW